MSRRAPLRFALTLLACAPALVGCGGDASEPDPPLQGARLTIYSSLPQRGPLRGVAADMLDAQRLALAQAGDRVGRYRVRLVPLDASTPEAGRSDPSQISRNARRAAEDPEAVAYLGELASGSSAIAIPLLNEAGILEVSPLDTALALTSASRAVTGSPERFYPKLKDVGRTFARVVPSDRRQVDALLAWMRAAGVQRLAILTDEDPSGRAIATNLRAKARAAGIAVVAREEIDEHAREHEDQIARVVEAGPDAALDATGPRPGAARLWRELVAADPELLLFAPANRAEPAFLKALGPAAAAARLTRPVLAEGDDPPASWRFARAFARRYGHAPDPQAVYGYEAMRSLLEAIRRAEADPAGGDLTRAAVVREYFRTGPRESVLGAYAIGAGGDTSLERWGAYRVVDGRLRFARALSGGGAQPPSAER